MPTIDTLIARICAQQNVTDHRIIEGMRYYQRDLFIVHNKQAFEDIPLAIGYGQTATAPSLIASILDIAQLQPHHHVLEIGTGSGYQTALIAHMSSHVTSLDIVPAFTKHAQRRLQHCDLKNIDVKTQDGHISCGDTKFDRIIINAAIKQVPPALLAQLQPNGTVIAPLDKRFHQQKIVRISGSNLEQVYTTSIPARFLGLTQLRGNHATV